MSKKSAALLSLEKHFSTALKKGPPPDLAVTLGSGFKSFARAVACIQSVPFAKIAGFPVPKVAGHGADLLLAEISGRRIWLMSGRAHMYEGHSAAAAVLPLRTLMQAGVNKVILTNAAGSLRKDFAPGDAILLHDHINLTGQNCLLGTHTYGGPQFVDMTNAYDAAWRERIRKKIVGMKEGVYLGLLGPNYETRAECRMMASWGADLVGMSTVQETLAARQMGAKVCGISLVSNYAGGLFTDSAVNHAEVLEQGNLQAEKLARLLSEVVKWAE